MGVITSSMRCCPKHTQSPSLCELAQTKMMPEDPGKSREFSSIETAAAVPTNIQLRGAASAEEQSSPTDVKTMTIAKVLRGLR